MTETVEPKAPAVNTKSGNQGMIVPFWGEFMVSPPALEWSLNYCSHGCSYCFANLNTPTRKGDASKALRQVADIGKRKTLTDFLLRNKYPIVVSNKVDAFSESNYREMLPVLLTMIEEGVPLQFQTKGAHEGGAMDALDRVLQDLPPSVWYITVAQSDDTLRKKIEPAAPSLQARYALMDKLSDAGHWIVAGVNPAVPEWIPDPEKLATDLEKHDVWGAWMERLHLSQKQLLFMPGSHKKAIGDTLITRALVSAKRMPTEDAMFLEEMRENIVGAGMEPYSYFYPDRTDFFHPWRECYDHFMPLMQDFVNFCIDNSMTERDLIAFDEYVQILENGCGALPKGVHHIGDYMRVASWRSIERISNWSDNMTYRQMLWYTWSNPGTKLAPASHPQFAIPVVGEGEDEAILTDDKGHPYHVFVPDGHLSPYIAWDMDTGGPVPNDDAT